MQILQQMIDGIIDDPKYHHGWVLDGRFNTVAAFINGYEFATQQLTGLDRNETIIGRFRYWLGQRFYKSHGIARNLGWEWYITKVWEDDNTRLEQLRLLLNEFLNEQELDRPAV